MLPFLTEVHFPLISDRNKNPQRNDVPERLEISHARNEKDHSLDAPYVENFSHTEYQSEATVYAYLKQVSDFLKRYQELDAEYALLPPEPYDPQNYLLQWRLHMRELINELFNMFVGGNLFSAAAMTRTLMECCVYGKVLKQEDPQPPRPGWGAAAGKTQNCVCTLQRMEPRAGGNNPAVQKGQRKRVAGFRDPGQRPDLLLPCL